MQDGQAMQTNYRESLVYASSPHYSRDSLGVGWLVRMENTFSNCLGRRNGWHFRLGLPLATTGLYGGETSNSLVSFRDLS